MIIAFKEKPPSSCITWRLIVDHLRLVVHSIFYPDLDMLALVVCQDLFLEGPFNQIMTQTFNKHNPERSLKEAIVMTAAGIKTTLYSHQ